MYVYICFIIYVKTYDEKSYFLEWDIQLKLFFSDCQKSRFFIFFVTSRHIPPALHFLISKYYFYLIFISNPLYRFTDKAPVGQIADGPLRNLKEIMDCQH